MSRDTGVDSSANTGPPSAKKEDGKQEMIDDIVAFLKTQSVSYVAGLKKMVRELFDCTECKSLERYSDGWNCFECQGKECGRILCISCWKNEKTHLGIYCEGCWDEMAPIEKDDAMRREGK